MVCFSLSLTFHVLPSPSESTVPLSLYGTPSWTCISQTFFYICPPPPCPSQTLHIPSSRPCSLLHLQPFQAVTFLNLYCTSKFARCFPSSSTPGQGLLAAGHVVHFTFSFRRQFQGFYYEWGRCFLQDFFLNLKISSEIKLRINRDLTCIIY